MRARSKLTGIFRLSGVARGPGAAQVRAAADLGGPPPHIQLAPDGSSLAVWKDASRTADELRRFSPKDAPGLAGPGQWRWNPIMDVVVALHEVAPACGRFNREDGQLAAGAPPVTSRVRGGLRNMVTASHTEFLEETFETELPKGALAAMAAFFANALGRDRLGNDLSRYRTEGFETRLPVGGTGALPARAASLSDRARRHGAHQQAGAGARRIQTTA